MLLLRGGFEVDDSGGRTLEERFRFRQVGETGHVIVEGQWLGRRVVTQELVRT